MQKVILRGGGDLASGIAIKLIRCGYKVVITELEKPLSVRRKVSFSEAIYDGAITIEGITGRRIGSATEALSMLDGNDIPVLVDPNLAILKAGGFDALIDSRLKKSEQNYFIQDDLFIVGLGPGFSPGKNCHAAIETERGHTLGRVYWTGTTNADTGLPEGDARRVFRAPCTGIVRVITDIGATVEAGELMAQVGELDVHAPIGGVIRGMIRDGTLIQSGVKLGDVDARNDPSYCTTVSDKAFAVAGGVLEALIVHQNRKNAS